MRYPRIKMFGETIRDAGTQALGGIVFGIYGNIAELTIGTQVVQAAYMVVMFVSDKYGIDGLEIVQTEHLLTEVRTAIDENPYSVHFYQPRAPQTVVARVFAGADRAGTPYLRYSRRGSAT
jgi:hypothetical protein